MTVGECLRGLRVQSQMTQAALAAELGVTDSLISHIEAGRRSPSLELLQSIAQLMGLPAALLIVAAILDGEELPTDLRRSYEALRRATELANA